MSLFKLGGATLISQLELQGETIGLTFIGHT
jgi:hypothetical protein